MNEDVMEVKIQEHEEAIKDHEKRIDAVEKDGAKFEVCIENMCGRLDSLISWIKALILGIVGTALTIIIEKVIGG